MVLLYQDRRGKSVLIINILETKGSVYPRNPRDDCSNDAVSQHHNILCSCYCTSFALLGLPNHLVNGGFLWSTGEHKLILALEGKQVPPWDIRVVLSLQPPLCRIWSMLVNLELHNLLPGSIYSPLAEVVVPTNTIDGCFVGAELDIEDFTNVCLPTTEALLLKHIWDRGGSRKKKIIKTVTIINSEL